MNETKNKFKFMFHCMEGTGHMNACVGFAQILLANGHEIVFVVNESLTKAVEKFGFRIIPLKQDSDGNDGEKKFILSDNPAKDFAESLQKSGLFSNKTSLEKMNIFKDDHSFMEGLTKLMISFNPQIEKILEQEKPHAWIHDNFLIPPAIPKSNIPWILICSASPLTYYNSEFLPPPGSGYPANDKSKWAKFIESREGNIKQFKEYQNRINKIFDYEDKNNDEDSNDFFRSPYLNIFQYPDELNWTADGFEWPNNFVGVDAFVRHDPGKFELPEEFLSKKTGSDKMIYLSLGSMGSFDIDVMQKIISILSNLPYKVIVSKGPRGNEYELPSNCWGENYVPQPEIVEMVDLVITHGGNNSFTETFASGKPMIVMPLFGDQYDNAQRIHETGYGIRIEPYNFTEKELVDAIHKLMNDESIHEKLAKAKERIDKSNRKEDACKKVEEFIAKHYSLL